MALLSWGAFPAGHPMEFACVHHFSHIIITYHYYYSRCYIVFKGLPLSYRLRSAADNCDDLYVDGFTVAARWRISVLSSVFHLWMQAENVFPMTSVAAVM